jgi:hypothetical protein
VWVSTKNGLFIVRGAYHLAKKKLEKKKDATKTPSTFNLCGRKYEG